MHATMYAAPLRFRACSPSPSLARRSLFGEWVAESKVVGQVQKRFRVMLVGPHPGLPPTPYGVVAGPQAAGNLRPRQARLLLEPLREVVEEDAQVILLWWACCRGMAQNLPAHNRRHSPRRAGGGQSLGEVSSELGNGAIATRYVSALTDLDCPLSPCSFTPTIR